MLFLRARRQAGEVGKASFFPGEVLLFSGFCSQCFQRAAPRGTGREEVVARVVYGCREAKRGHENCHCRHARDTRAVRGL
jgi:hypothetical protein